MGVHAASGSRCLMRRCASYQAYKRNITVGRIRRLRRIRQPLPDATLYASYQAYKPEHNRRPDKAFTPHPAARKKSSTAVTNE
ncbi:hypothetical protein ACLB1E_09690 [Escherichia coli]